VRRSARRPREPESITCSCRPTIQARIAALRESSSQPIATLRAHVGRLNLFVGLHSRDSGLFAKPDAMNRPAPRVAYAHPKARPPFRLRVRIFSLTMSSIG